MLFTDRFWEDLEYWLATDIKTFRRLLRIVREILHDPFNGIAKPEPMKHQYRGCWSRRLTDEHRLVYRVHDDAIGLLAARFHYEE